MASGGKIKISLNTKTLEQQMRVCATLLEDFGNSFLAISRRLVEGADKFRNVREGEE